MKMKYTLTLFFILGLPQGYAFTSQFSCDRVIFSGLTVKKDKKVQVCLNKEEVIYTFGSVEPVPPEVDIRIPPRAVNWFKYTTPVWDPKLPPGKKVTIFNEGLSLTHGSYRYQLTHGKNGDTRHETINVYYQNKRLSKFRLRPETVYSHIDDYLWDDFAIARVQPAIW